MGIDDIANKLKDAVDTVKEKAEQIIDERGGMEGIKEDLKEAKDAITGEGSLKEKAQGVVDALKDPGKPGE